MKDTPPLINLFIQHCGEMGSRWGMNRSVGQIFALLYLSTQPLNAQEMVTTLGISRSNVSMGLKELMAWRLLSVSHRAGDRNEYYATSSDIWQVLRALAAEKRRRELEPTLLFLHEALGMETTDAESGHALERMHEMYELLDLFNTWFDDMQKLSPQTLVRLMRLGSRVARVLDMGSTPQRE